MIDFLRSVIHAPMEPPPSPINGQREARLAALKAHQDRVLADLSGTLGPEERRQMARLMDDRRYLDVRRDD